MGILDDYTNEHEEKEVKFSIIIIIISIFALNTASGFTTFWGVDRILDDVAISVIVTIGIQGFLVGIALWITTTENISHKFIFLLLYFTPFITSITFNYIFFHTKFSDSANKQISAENVKINTENIRKLYLGETVNFITSIGEQLNSKILTLKTKESELFKAMNEELTDRGTGGAGPGRVYRTKRDEYVKTKKSREVLLTFRGS